mmetsp:Transcript_23663/g.33923  ORF Transcript_23663/g.33923 Transcript_23663/m.33923 type:complete len:91 (-) Transcript_23663:212-484(-)
MASTAQGTVLKSSTSYSPTASPTSTKSCPSESPSVIRLRSDSRSYWVCDSCHQVIPDNEIVHLREGEAHTYPCVDGFCKHEEKTLHFSRD